MQTLGNFEKLATHYHNARQGFVEDVFRILKDELVGLRGKRVLDIGCGTGIATRQLIASGATITGTDVSAAMIDQAKQADPTTSYIVASTNALPFDNGAFDCITAFSAFHWFCDKESVTEIKRVLKLEGTFFVINKNDIGGIRRDVVKLFEKYAPSTITRAKEGYKPETILAMNGFEKINTHKMAHSETYSLGQAVEYLQSIALWNQVAEENKENLLLDIETYCKKSLDPNGFLYRQLETVVVSGTLVQ